MHSNITQRFSGSHAWWKPDISVFLKFVSFLPSHIVQLQMFQSSQHKFWSPGQAKTYHMLRRTLCISTDFGCYGSVSRSTHRPGRSASTEVSFFAITFNHRPNDHLVLIIFRCKSSTYTGFSAIFCLHFLSFLPWSTYHA